MAKKKIEVRQSGSDYQIRMRKPGYPETVSVDIPRRGRIAATLYPGKWVSVPEEIFQVCKSKFDLDRETPVPDVEYHERFPHPMGEAPRMVNEADNSYIMEFRERKESK